MGRQTSEPDRAVGSYLTLVRQNQFTVGVATGADQ